MVGKRAFSRIPGAVETYKLLKNLRYRTRAGLGTQGNLDQLGMDREAAARYVRDIFGKIDGVVREFGGWAGKRVLEIGPGDSLGAGFLAIARGARSYFAIDRFPVRFDPESERAVLADIREELSDEERRRLDDAVGFDAAGPRFDEERFAYFNSVAIEEAPRRFGHEAFDVVFSNAVLEHVRSVESSLEAMRRMLAPGGVMLHDVDLRSHQRFEKHELHFLEYRSFLWRLMTSHTGEPNRVRRPDYLRTLARLGFRDVRSEVTLRFDEDLIARVRPRLAEEFRSLPADELSVAAFRVSARTPPAGA